MKDAEATPEPSPAFRVLLKAVLVPGEEGGGAVLVAMKVRTAEVEALVHLTPAEARNLATGLRQSADEAEVHASPVGRA